MDASTKMASNGMTIEMQMGSDGWCKRRFRLLSGKFFLEVASIFVSHNVSLSFVREKMEGYVIVLVSMDLIQIKIHRNRLI